MTYIPDTVGVVTGTLAAAVANNGTLTISYPSGFAQADFIGGLAGTNSYIVLNGNDKYTSAASKMSLTFNASDITVTNTTGATWAAGSDYAINLDARDNNSVRIISIPLQLAAITSATTLIDGLKVPMAGVLEYVEFVPTTPVTTASKAATINVFVDAASTAAASVALTSANAVFGAPIANSADPTANNTLTRASKLKITSTSVTAFSEGSGVLCIHIRASVL